MDPDTPGIRLSILGVVAVSLFVVLVARLWYLQILAPQTGEAESALNRIRVLPIEAPRGRILDVRGRVLVDNRTSLVVTIDRHRLDTMKDDARRDFFLGVATELTKAGVPMKVAD